MALQESGFAFAIRDSTWIYPIANLTHILGLALLVGSILILDLRVLEQDPGQPPQQLHPPHLG